MMSSLLDRPRLGEDWVKETRERNGSSSPPAGRHESNGDHDKVPEAGSWEPIVREIVAFQHLGEDWDGQGARPPSEEVLKSAIGLAYTLYEQGMDPPSRVVPGPEGSVLFEWQDPDGSYAEVEVVGWLVAEVMVIGPGQPARHWTLPNENRPSEAGR